MSTKVTHWPGKTTLSQSLQLLAQKKDVAFPSSDWMTSRIKREKGEEDRVNFYVEFRAKFRTAFLDAKNSVVLAHFPILLYHPSTCGSFLWESFKNIARQTLSSETWGSWWLHTRSWLACLLSSWPNTTWTTLECTVHEVFNLPKHIWFSLKNRNKH